MRVVVSVHDVSPGRIDEAREWCRLLDPLVCGPLSLLVVPRAAGSESWRYGPAAAWLKGRGERGDELVLHGYTHRDRSGRDGKEFAHCPPGRLAALLADGRRELDAVGLQTDGMIPPAYGVSPGLAQACWDQGIGWWADRWRVNGAAGRMRLPSVSLGASRPLRRVASQLIVRPAAWALMWGGVLRVDLHTADLHHLRVAQAGLGTVADLIDRGARPVTHRELLAAA